MIPLKVPWPQIPDLENDNWCGRDGGQERSNRCKSGLHILPSHPSVRKKDRDRERVRWRDREKECVCVRERDRVSERERERERES